MEIPNDTGFITWALGVLGGSVVGLFTWLLTYERRMTKNESKIEENIGHIKTLYEKSNSLSEKIDTKIGILESKLDQQFGGMRGEIRELSKAVWTQKQ